MKNNHPLVTALLSSIGSGLEYYAFICFALQAATLSELFFTHQQFALMETFGTFAVGSVLTLLGGYLFGIVGDRIGRKKVFLSAIVLMTVATVGIGLLPVHWGIFGLALLLILRMLQGIAQGAELPGAITFISEHAKNQQRGLSSGLLFFGVGMGAALATLINFLINHYFTATEIHAYAWRIPFLCALILGFVGYILRRKTVETPLFLSELQKEQHLNWHNVWQEAGNPLKVLQGFGLVWLAAVMVSLGLFWPSFLTHYLNYAQSSVYLAMTLAFVLTALLLPFLGYLSDVVGRKRLYFIGLLILVMTAYPMIKALAGGSHQYLYLFSFWYYLMIVILAANYPVMLAELFPTTVRYQSVGLSYAGCYAVAGIVPVVASSLALKFAILPVLIGLLYVSAGISALAWWFYQEQRGDLA